MVEGSFLEYVIDKAGEKYKRLDAIKRPSAPSSLSIASDIELAGYFGLIEKGGNKTYYFCCHLVDRQWWEETIKESIKGPQKLLDLDKHRKAVQASPALAIGMKQSSSSPNIWSSNGSNSIAIAVSTAAPLLATSPPASPAMGTSPSPLQQKPTLGQVGYMPPGLTGSTPASAVPAAIAQTPASSSPAPARRRAGHMSGFHSPLRDVEPSSPANSAPIFEESILSLTLVQQEIGSVQRELGSFDQQAQEKQLQQLYATDPQLSAQQQLHLQQQSLLAQQQQLQEQQQLLQHQYQQFQMQQQRLQELQQLQQQTQDQLQEHGPYEGRTEQHQHQYQLDQQMQQGPFAFDEEQAAVDQQGHYQLDQDPQHADQQQYGMHQQQDQAQFVDPHAYAPPTNHSQAHDLHLQTEQEVPHSYQMGTGGEVGRANNAHQLDQPSPDQQIDHYFQGNGAEFQPAPSAGPFAPEVPAGESGELLDEQSRLLAILNQSQGGQSAPQMQTELSEEDQVAEQSRVLAMLDQSAGKLSSFPSVLPPQAARDSFVPRARPVSRANMGAQVQESLMQQLVALQIQQVQQQMQQLEMANSSAQTNAGGSNSSGSLQQQLQMQQLAAQQMQMQLMMMIGQQPGAQMPQQSYGQHVSPEVQQQFLEQQYQMQMMSDPVFLQQLQQQQDQLQQQQAHQHHQPGANHMVRLSYVSFGFPADPSFILGGILQV